MGDAREGTLELLTGVNKVPFPNKEVPLRIRSAASVINDDVEVTVLEIKGDQVKIGINAPKSVPIYRKELYVQIQKANEEAMNSADPTALNELFK